MELPWNMYYAPAGTAFRSQAGAEDEVLIFAGRHAFLAVGVADPRTGGAKYVEGLNERGLSFSLLAFASSEGPAEVLQKTWAVLAAIDLGA